MRWWLAFCAVFCLGSCGQESFPSEQLSEVGFPDGSVERLLEQSETFVSETTVVQEKKPLKENERKTTLGVIRGVKEGETWVFRGIPFAAPPIGPNRFRPPMPHPGWDGVRETIKFGSLCMQYSKTLKRAIGSEDCLTLNLWEPSKPSATQRPIMVWIHGGDNVRGTASEDAFFGGKLYDGQQIATNGDVILVSVEYRVAAFGFLSHPGFASENSRKSTGNWGLMDILAALEWVQNNAAQFGGDPTNVTLFGHSAGADNTCALTASLRSKGLFHKAITMSSGGCHYNPPQVSKQVTNAVFLAMGCDKAIKPTECIRAVSAEKLAQAPQSGSPLRSDRIDFYVSLDGWLLSRSPRELYKDGKHYKIPMILGTTTEEYTINLGRSLPSQMTEADYLNWLKAMFGDNLAEEIRKLYEPKEYNGSFQVGLIAALGDAVHHCRVREIARHIAKNQEQKIYRYVYNHRYSDSRLASYYAAHGFDVPMVFSNFVGQKLQKSERTLSSYMQRGFVQFARTGSPLVKALPLWPSFDPSKDEYALASTQWRQIANYRKKQCDFWDTIWSR